MSKGNQGKPTPAALPPKPAKPPTIVRVTAKNGTGRIVLDHVVADGFALSVPLSVNALLAAKPPPRITIEVIEPVEEAHAEVASDGAEPDGQDAAKVEPPDA